jgi:hypothetical protein
MDEPTSDSQWWITFRAILSPRTFENETDAKNFARAKFNEGLIVYAGTTNPYSPREVIPSSSIPLWLERRQKQITTDPTDAQEAEK